MGQGRYQVKMMSKKQFSNTFHTNNMRNNICTGNSCLDFTETFRMCVEIQDIIIINNRHTAMSIPVDYGN